MEELASSERPDLADPSDPGDIVACVAHEMKTPLTALLQALHVLSSGRSGPLAAAQQRFVSMALANARALLALTGRLQDAARWDAGGPTIRFDAFDLVLAARSVAESLAALAESRTIRIDVTADENLPESWGDEDLIRDLIFNLAGNALKFTRPGGHIRVVVRRHEGAGSGWLEVAVRDDGPGIPPGEEERIFERYYQAGGGRGRHEGLGLGLALARMIALAHGGTLGARNNDGRGATFSARLPAFGSGHAAQAQLRRVLLDAGSLPVVLVAIEAPGRRASELLSRLGGPFDLAGSALIDLGRNRIGLAWPDSGKDGHQPRIVDALCREGWDLVAGRVTHRGGTGDEGALLQAANDALESGLRPLAAITVA